MQEASNNNFWELVTGKIHNENNPEEIDRVDKLLKKTENKKSFNQIENIHNRLYKIKPLYDVSHERSWGRVNDYFKKKRIRLVLTVTRYAAIILVTLLVGKLILPGWKLSSESIRLAEVVVPLGQMSEITLYDGTHVWLNSGTTLKYTNNFGKKNRNVVLDGEAFFKVKHCKIPFRVQLKNSEIEVLGTSFNAISYKDENVSQVTLVEGSVKINTSSGKEITTIKPSQQIIIPDNLKDVRVYSVNTDFYYSWTEGKIVFAEERLTDVVKRLERWYNVEIRFEGKEIGNLRFSGTILKNKPFDQIIKAFKLLLPVNITYQYNLEKKDVLIISKLDMPMKN